ncbi:hypothetical protein [Streptomyces sp. NPDC001744]|uniref:hypothetical protein n=1 Tax=Streptomyces sp. NPDC001744 TaxID=3364606 RepID=UPI0036A2F3DE
MEQLDEPVRRSEAAPHRFGFGFGFGFQSGQLLPELPPRRERVPATEAGRHAASHGGPDSS